MMSYELVKALGYRIKALEDILNLPIFRSLIAENDGYANFCQSQSIVPGGGEFKRAVE